MLIDLIRRAQADIRSPEGGLACLDRLLEEVGELPTAEGETPDDVFDREYAHWRGFSKCASAIGWRPSFLKDGFGTEIACSWRLWTKSTCLHWSSGRRQALCVRPRAALGDAAGVSPERARRQPRNHRSIGVVGG